MREWIDLVEGMRRADGLTQQQLMRAIYQYAKDHCQNGDTAETWSEFTNNVRNLKSHLSFPLKVYRGFEVSGEGDDFDFDGWNAHQGGECPEDLARTYANKGGECPEDLARTYANKIDFSQIGTSWTWDKNVATVGGALDNYGSAFAHVIVEAEVTSNQVDLLVTLWQNLTTYQEEKEARLFPNTVITVTGIIPSNCGLTFPIMANTGPEMAYDTRDKVVEELLRFGYL